MRFPCVRSGDDPTPFAWWEWACYPIFSLLVLAGLGLITPLVLVAIPFLIFASWWKEMRFARQMRAQRRFIDWGELKPRLLAGQGTLIVEQAHKKGVRVWWTPDDVPAAMPTHMPYKEPGSADYGTSWSTPSSFVFWCHDRYLQAATGMGKLTNPPYSYPPGFVEAKFFEAKFPFLKVVMTVKLM